MPQNEKNAKPIGGPGGRGGHGPRPNVKNPGKLFMRLLSYIMKNYAVHCVIVVICIFITVLASVQGTWFMQTLIDGYILPLMKQSDPDFSGLAHAILRVAVFYGIGAIAAYIYTRIMVNVSQGTLKHLRDDMFTHMEELPIRYFDTHSHGDIMSTYTNDIDTLRQMISQSMPQFLNSIISIVSVFISMLLLNIPLTLVTLVMVGVTLFATKKIGALSARYFIAQQKDIATVNGYIEEMMNGQKVVKVFTHEEESIADFNRLNDQLFHSADNANKFGNILMPVNAQIGNISYVLCAIVGGILALGGYGGFTLGKLASFLTYNKSFGQPINQLSMQLNNIVMALAGSERIFALLDEQPEVDDGYVTLVRAKWENGQIVESKERTGMWAWKHTHQADGSVDYIELKGDVVFDDVDFGYVPEKTVLHNVDLYATPGQKIAFVGSPGAGKTVTAVKLAAELAKRKKNVVLVFTDLTAPSLPAVAAEGKLPEVSVGELLSAPGMTQEQVLKTCVPCEKHPYISFLGYKAGENVFTYAEYSKEKAVDMLVLLRHIADYVIVDCTSVLTGNVLATAALEVADDVLRMCGCDLKAISYFASYLPLIEHRKFKPEQHIRALSNTRPYPGGMEYENSFGGVKYRLPYLPIVEEQAATLKLLEPLAGKEAKSYEPVIAAIAAEVFGDGK